VPSELKNLTLLYVEDDTRLRHETLRSLKPLVYRVHDACSGAEALEILEREHIDVVLSDYVMPVMDGYELTCKIRENDADIPVIILSGHSDKEKLLSVIDLNLTSYLLKPLRYDTLVQALEKALERLENRHRLWVTLDATRSYNVLEKRLQYGDESIRLSRHESDFLELLLANRGYLVDKGRVETHIYSDSVESNTLRNMVYRLRKKGLEGLVVTVKDIGYLLKVSE